MAKKSKPNPFAKKGKNDHDGDEKKGGFVPFKKKSKKK